MTRSKSQKYIYQSKKVKVTTKNRQVKTKGDRLGWTLRSEVKHVPLREIAGRGRIVSETFGTHLRFINREAAEYAAKTFQPLYMKYIFGID